MLGKLQGDHGALGALAQDLRVAVAHAEAPDPDRLAQLQWTYASLLMRHLAAEDALLYGPLRASADPDARAAMARTDPPLLALREDFAAHMRDWPAGAACADWAGYRAALTPLLDRVEQRIRHEERLIYPLAARLGARPGEGRREAAQ